MRDTNSPSTPVVEQLKKTLGVLGVFMMLAVLTPLTQVSAASQNEVLLSLLYDGTPVGLSGNFDVDPLGSATTTGTVPEPHTPGLDAGPQNGVVKTFDSYAVRIDWNINEDAATNVVLTAVLESHSIWSPDVTGMFSGCDPALSSFPNPQTLECHLGDQPEGSNGAIRAVATLQAAADSDTFNVTTTLTTADDAVGVTDQLDTDLTISEAPIADWVKALPEVFGPVNDGSEDGWVFLYPLSLVDYSHDSPAFPGSGPLNDTVALNFFDHAYGLTSSATVANAAQMTAAGIGARSSCGAYDGTGPFPVTPGIWSCGTETSPNGYTVVPISVAGQNTSAPPALNVDGSPNVGTEGRKFPDGSERPGAIAVQGQVAFWISDVDVQAEIDDASNDSPTSALFFNSIGANPAAFDVTDQLDVVPVQLPGTTGTTAELTTVDTPSEPDNNTRQNSLGTGIQGPAGPSAQIGHNIAFVPGPLKLLETQRFGDLRIGADVRGQSVGGTGFFPGSDENHGDSTNGDHIGQTPRGARFTINTHVLTAAVPNNGTLYDAPIGGCVAFDTAHYSLASFDAPIPVTQTLGDATNDSMTVTGGYDVTANHGPLAHVLTGEASGTRNGLRGQFAAIGGDVTGLDVSLEFTDAPIQYHSGSSFGAEDDGITCNDTDAGASGWVDGATGDLSVFDTVNQGDGLFEGITRARYRITERFPWASDDSDSFNRGVVAWFQAEVKTDLNVNTADQELFAMMSHTFGEYTTGAGDLVPYEGASSLGHCNPYIPQNWEANGNAVATSTGWCNNRFQDDGTNSFDTSDIVDWDNSSWTQEFTTAGTQFYVNATGTVMSIVEAQLGLEKTNDAGPNDVKDNGQLVEFTLRPSVIGSDQEALTSVLLVDDLPPNYHFVQFLSQPTTPGASCTAPPTPDGSIICRFSEANPAVDTGPLPAGLEGGWSDEFRIQVEVVGAIANPDSPTQITNTATLLSSGIGLWDSVANDLSGPITTSNKNVQDSASSFMPLPADEGAIIKVVDTLEGPCTAYPDAGAAPAGWGDRCSLIEPDDNMSFQLQLTNEGNTAFNNIRFVDVFPHAADEVEPISGTPIQGGSPSTVGDGRSPESDFAGTLGFVSLVGADAFWVTGDASSTISRDPNNAVLDTVWCDAVAGVQVAGPTGGTCPASATAVTATYSVVAGPLNPGQTLTQSLTLDSQGVGCADIWTNTFGVRVDEVLLPIRSNDVSIMVNCDYDLALEKSVDAAFVPGTDWITPGTTTIDFLIEVTNQADQIEDFTVTDYVDTAVFTFDPANNAAGTTSGDAVLPFTWDVTDPAKPTASIDGILPAGDAVTIPVTLTIESAAGPLTNWAEISSFDNDGDPSNGNSSSGAMSDVDSTPNADQADDAQPTGPDAPGDGALTGNGDGLDPITGDEDDHDIAGIPVFDLALEKVVRDPVFDLTVTPWHTTFDITVTNEGTADVFDVDVTEYAPTGLVYDAAATAALWTAEGLTGITDASPTFTIAGPIAADATVTFPLVFDIADPSGSPYLNAAEISAFDDDNDPGNTPGPFVLDADSTTDATNGDDPAEDDHDTALVSLPWDLALAKTFVAMDSPLVPGGNVSMLLTVTNQGPAVEEIDVVDYLDPSMWAAFSPVDNPNGAVDASSTATGFGFSWDATDPQNPVALVRPDTAGDVVGTGETVVIPIVVTVAAGIDLTQPLTNTAEISRFDSDGDPTNGDSDPTNPDNPATGPIVDIDSTPDLVDGSAPGELGDLIDDDIAGDGSPGTDEDDHDIVTIPIMDLALRKTVDPNMSFPVANGDDVTFILEIINQGNTHASSISIVDYVDSSMWDAFSPASNPAGTSTGDAALAYTWATSTNGQDGDLTIADVLAPGQTVFIPVTLTIASGADLAMLSQAAEISAATASTAAGVEVTNPDQTTVVDVDSTADATNDDPTTDDIVDGTGGDEDDHDIALVQAPTYSLGDQVWLDTNNDGILDADEDPLSGVIVHLFVDADGDGFADDSNGDGIIDASDALATATTDADGSYLFQDLDAGDYIVGIAPENWDDGGALDAMLPSATNSADPNNDVDGDNSGSVGADGYVMSGPVSIEGTEPVGEPGGADVAPDVFTNLTVDFGFHRPVFDLSLEKRLADGQASTDLSIDDDVTYTIEITNEGNVDAADISVIDYPPAGLTLNDNDWTANADGSVVTELTGVTIAPGESARVDVTMTITASGTLDNHAEISSAVPLGEDGAPLTEPNGTIIADIDSVADATNDDGGAEDDHDIASITVVGASVTRQELTPVLAFTGRESYDLAATAILLILLGIGLALLGVDRREPSAGTAD